MNGSPSGFFISPKRFKIRRSPLSLFVIVMKVFSSVIMNGSPSGFFKSPKRFKIRRSPLSLFEIVMKVFSCLLNKAESGGCLSRWQVRSKGGDGFQILIYYMLMTIWCFVRGCKTR